jgi:hypothetical protein
MGTKPGERMMVQLERRAEAISRQFNSQDIANTLWAYATMRTKPGERMMGQLERRAEAISGEFNSQGIANTLWAFATMGTKPGERMMGQLERRVEAISGEFNSQNVANTLWAFATMGTKPGERMMGQLERRMEAIAGEFNSQHVASTLWSYAVLDILPSERVCNTLRARARQLLWGGYYCAKIMWCCAKLSGRNESTRAHMKLMIEAVMSTCEAQSLQARHIAIVAWAHAKMSIAIPQDMAKALCERADTVHMNFTKNDISLLIWSNYEIPSSGVIGRDLADMWLPNVSARLVHAIIDGCPPSQQPHIGESEFEERSTCTISIAPTTGQMSSSQDLLDTAATYYVQSSPSDDRELWQRAQLVHQNQHGMRFQLQCGRLTVCDRADHGKTWCSDRDVQVQLANAKPRVNRPTSAGISRLPRLEMHQPPHPQSRPSPEERNMHAALRHVEQFESKQTVEKAQPSKSSTELLPGPTSELGWNMLTAIEQAGLDICSIISTVEFTGLHMRGLTQHYACKHILKDLRLGEGPGDTSTCSGEDFSDVMELYGVRKGCMMEYIRFDHLLLRQIASSAARQGYKRLLDDIGYEWSKSE